MSLKEKASGLHKIDRKWVKEEKRIFTDYPGTPGVDFFGGPETWLELAQFYVEDLRWLLSLDHQKFWSHMIYSDNAHELLVTFLKKSPPKYMRTGLFSREDVKNIYKEMEHLVFLLFIRLSTEKESESCYVKNLGEIIYNNYLFTVPIILDICLIYGASNGDLVKKMINDVITWAPYFLDDFQEIIPHFIQVLRAVREKFSPNHLPKLQEEAAARTEGTQDVVFYLYDSVATIQRFFELYPNVSSANFFSKNDLMTELASFYSNVLPVIEKHCKGRTLMCDLIKNVRIDMLKIVKSIFDFTLNEGSQILDRTQMVDEYLTLMTELLAEPVFFSDYNLIYSVEFELECAVRNCQDVDTVKLNHVLGGVASLAGYDRTTPNDSPPNIPIKSLITEVKAIFPHLGEDYIEKCLRHYDYNAERLITAVLENSIPSAISLEERNGDDRPPPAEFKGKHKTRHADFNELLDDREAKSAMKERCAQLCYVEDETYDDEYDDTYDENIDVSVKEGEEMARRPFVVPKVLRALEGEEDEEEEEEGEDEEEEEGEADGGSRNFVEDPALLRERRERLQRERDVVGRGRGRGQSREVMRNRGFKESHKSYIGNHNRKKQASRKMSRGMIPS